MKYLFTLLLLAISFTASAFPATIYMYDIDENESTRFYGCNVSLLSFKPRGEEASYLYSICDSYEEAFVPVEATVKEDDAIEEVGIFFTADDEYLERLDCYLEHQLITDDGTSEIFIECGRLPEVKPAIFRRRF